MFLPEERTLPRLREAVQGCRGCDLYRCATQAVFGEGPPRAEVMFVGEQPGNDEDLAGRPFVGPAGRLLEQGLVLAGVDRARVYVTNTVKHFKWEPRGKRRIHKKPDAAEVGACFPWLAAEIEVVRPRVLVLLGALAAQTVLGKAFRVTQQRGTWIPSTHAPHVMATVHPASILRAPDELRAQERARFFADLAMIGEALRTGTELR